MRQKILKRMWRICINRNCNDWNDEPEYIAVPYEILEEKSNSYICMRAGWHNKNTLPKIEFFDTKEICLEEISSRARKEDEKIEELRMKMLSEGRSLLCGKQQM